VHKQMLLYTMFWFSARLQLRLLPYPKNSSCSNGINVRSAVSNSPVSYLKEAVADDVTGRTPVTRPQFHIRTQILRSTSHLLFRRFTAILASRPTERGQQPTQVLDQNDMSLQSCRTLRSAELVDSATEHSGHWLR
jgi:hypothetical protein